MVTRPDWSADSLLLPHNEHPYAGPIVVYKLLLELFGMESTLPFRIVNVALVILVAWLVLVLVRRRMGPWAGLIAATLLLFMGAAWEDLLWPAGISFLGSIAAGLGAFVLLDREQRPRDAWVCALLVVSVCFSTLGLVFAIGVVADVLLREPQRPLRARLSRAWIPALPVILFGLWFLGYGHEGPSSASLDNVFGIPLYIWSAASAALASLAGLIEVDFEHAGAVVSEGWGKPLLVAALIGTAVLIARNPRVVSQRLWVFVLTAAAFWASAGLNTVVGREPGASRYQLIGGTLVILIAAELMRGMRPSRGALWVAGALTALAVVSGIGALRDGERVLRPESELAKAELSAVEIGGDRIDPALMLAELVSGSPYLATITVGPYLDAVERWGSPVDAPGDLLDASEENRALSDSMLAIALGAALEPSASSLVRPAECETLGPAASEIELPSEGILIDPEGAAAEVRLRRFASATPTSPLGTVTEPVLLQMPSDRSDVPWIAVVSGGPALACPAS